MKKIAFMILITLMVSTALLPAVERFEKVDTWTFENIFGFDFFSFVDKDNHIVGGFFKSIPSIISPKKIIEFAPRGQGPNDLASYSAGFNYNDDIAVLEHHNKLKIFTKKNGTYVWKETKWFKGFKYPQMVSDGLFLDNKFFFVGSRMNEKYKAGYIARMLSVFDQDGKLLAHPLEIKYPEINKFYLMDSFIAADNTGKVFVFLENELKAYTLNTKNMESIKAVELEVPAFYKKMPPESYADEDAPNIFAAKEKWQLSYSSISEVVVSGNHLVVQVRTCSDKLKKFALLFYHKDTLKLEKTFYNDDFLLDEKDGKFYCFAGGNPGRDFDPNNCVVNIYTVGK